MFYQTHRTQTAKPPAETEWSQPKSLYIQLYSPYIHIRPRSGAAYRVFGPNRWCVTSFGASAFHSVAAGGVIGVHRVFLSLVTLTFDL